MTHSELKSFLDEKVTQYNTRDFIDSDPVQIPHLFSQKEDIEIAGFLAATIAWGNRKMIIKNAHRMMELMGNAPYDFVLSHQEKDLKDLTSFVHRTFEKGLNTIPHQLVILKVDLPQIFVGLNIFLQSWANGRLNEILAKIQSTDINSIQ